MSNELDGIRAQQLHTAAMQAEWERRFNTYLKTPYNNTVKPFFQRSWDSVCDYVVWAGGKISLGWKHANPKISKEQHLESLVAEIGVQPDKLKVFQKHYFSLAPTVRKIIVMGFGLYRAFFRGSRFNAVMTVGPELYAQRKTIVDTVTAIPEAYQREWHKHKTRFVAAHLIFASMVMAIAYYYLNQEESAEGHELVANNGNAVALIYLPMCSLDALERAICRPMCFPKEGPIKEAIGWWSSIKTGLASTPSALVYGALSAPGYIVNTGYSLAVKVAPFVWTAFIEKTVCSAAIALPVSALASLPDILKKPLTPKASAEKQVAEYQAARKQYEDTKPTHEEYHTNAKRELTNFQRQKIDKVLELRTKDLQSPTMIIRLLDVGMSQTQVATLTELKETDLGPIVLKECERLSTEEVPEAPVEALKQALCVSEQLDKPKTQAFAEKFKQQVLSQESRLFSTRQAATVLGVNEDYFRRLCTEQMLASAHGLRVNANGGENII